MTTKMLFEMLLRGEEFDYSPSEDKMAGEQGYIVLMKDGIVKHSIHDEEGIAKTLQEMWNKAVEGGLWISCWTDDKPCFALSKNMGGLTEALKEGKRQGGGLHRVYCLRTERWVS